MQEGNGRLEFEVIALLFRTVRYNLFDEVYEDIVFDTLYVVRGKVHDPMK